MRCKLPGIVIALATAVSTGPSLAACSSSGGCTDHVDTALPLLHINLLESQYAGTPEIFHGRVGQKIELSAQFLDGNATAEPAVGSADPAVLCRSATKVVSGERLTTYIIREKGSQSISVAENDRPGARAAVNAMFARIDVP